MDFFCCSLFVLQPNWYRLNRANSCSYFYLRIERWTSPLYWYEKPCFTKLKFLGKEEWKRRKPQPEYRRQSPKLHIGIDAKTLQIRAVQLSKNNASDSQVLSYLLDQIPQGEQIDSVYTDGTYGTKNCRQVIAEVCLKPKCTPSNY